MKSSEYAYVAASCACAAVLSGCGGLQPPIGAPGATQQSTESTLSDLAATARTSAHHVEPASPSYQLLYSFGGGSDGAHPYAGLTNVRGTLYGTTSESGNSLCVYVSLVGCGTIFSVTTTGSENVLHVFGGPPADGGVPYASLVNVEGTMYGTTFEGGEYGYGGYPAGTIFSVTTTGTEKVLYSFGAASAAGFGPYANLIDVKGTLYGTTYDGGPNYLGTVFSVTRNGKQKVLHGFGYGADGAQPYAGLVNVKGVLYGTTPTGGAYGIGTIFSVTTTGKEKVLYSFHGGPDGENPDAALITIKGTLYGATSAGGPHYGGTVFSVTTAGREKTLYSFCAKRKCADGSGPEAQLVNVNGTLYGTTIYGGKYTCGGGPLCGTVFSITTAGREAVLHSFGSSGDGANPYARLVNVKGTLYGTTTNGGASGDGTVFALTPLR